MAIGGGEFLDEVKLLDLFKRDSGVWQQPGLVRVTIQRDPFHGPRWVNDDHIKLARWFLVFSDRDSIQLLSDVSGVYFPPGSRQAQLAVSDGFMHLAVLTF